MIRKFPLLTFLPFLIISCTNVKYEEYLNSEADFKNVVFIVSDDHHPKWLAPPEMTLFAPRISTGWHRKECFLPTPIPIRPSAVLRGSR